MQVNEDEASKASRLIKETLYMMAKNSISYKNSLTVEALIIITIDASHIFKVNINETCGNATENSNIYNLIQTDNTITLDNQLAIAPCKKSQETHSKKLKFNNNNNLQFENAIRPDKNLPIINQFNPATSKNSRSRFPSFSDSLSNMAQNTLNHHSSQVIPASKKRKLDENISNFNPLALVIQRPQFRTPRIPQPISQLSIRKPHSVPKSLKMLSYSNNPATFSSVNKQLFPSSSNSLSSIHQLSSSRVNNSATRPWFDLPKTIHNSYATNLPQYKALTFQNSYEMSNLFANNDHNRLNNNGKVLNTPGIVNRSTSDPRFFLNEVNNGYSCRNNFSKPSLENQNDKKKLFGTVVQTSSIRNKEKSLGKILLPNISKSLSNNGSGNGQINILADDGRVSEGDPKEEYLRKMVMQVVQVDKIINQNKPVEKTISSISNISKENEKSIPDKIETLVEIRNNMLLRINEPYKNSPIVITPIYSSDNLSKSVDNNHNLNDKNQNDSRKNLDQIRKSLNDSVEILDNISNQVVTTASVSHQWNRINALSVHSNTLISNSVDNTPESITSLLSGMNSEINTNNNLNFSSSVSSSTEVDEPLTVSSQFCGMDLLRLSDKEILNSAPRVCNSKNFTSVMESNPLNRMIKAKISDNAMVKSSTKNILASDAVDIQFKPIYLDIEQNEFLHPCSTNLNSLVEDTIKISDNSGSSINLNQNKVIDSLYSSSSDNNCSLDINLASDNNFNSLIDLHSLDILGQLFDINNKIPVSCVVNNENTISINLSNKTSEIMECNSSTVGKNVGLHDASQKGLLITPETVNSFENLELNANLQIDKSGEKRKNDSKKSEHSNQYFSYQPIVIAPPDDASPIVRLSPTQMQAGQVSKKAINTKHVHKQYSYNSNVIEIESDEDIIDTNIKAINSIEKIDFNNKGYSYNNIYNNNLNLNWNRNLNAQFSTTPQISNSFHLAFDDINKGIYPYNDKVSKNCSLIDFNVSSLSSLPHQRYFYYQNGSYYDNAFTSACMKNNTNSMTANSLYYYRPPSLDITSSNNLTFNNYNQGKSMINESCSNLNIHGSKNILPTSWMEKPSNVNNFSSYFDVFKINPSNPICSYSNKNHSNICQPMKSLDFYSINQSVLDVSVTSTNVKNVTSISNSTLLQQGNELNSTKSTDIGQIIEPNYIGTAKEIAKNQLKKLLSKNCNELFADPVMSNFQTQMPVYSTEKSLTNTSNSITSNCTTFIGSNINLNTSNSINAVVKFNNYQSKDSSNTTLNNEISSYKNDDFSKATVNDLCIPSQINSIDQKIEKIKIKCINAKKFNSSLSKTNLKKLSHVKKKAISSSKFNKFNALQNEKEVLNETIKIWNIEVQDSSNNNIFFNRTDAGNLNLKESTINNYGSQANDVDKNPVTEIDVSNVRSEKIKKDINNENICVNTDDGKAENSFTLSKILEDYRLSELPDITNSYHISNIFTDDHSEITDVDRTSNLENMDNQNREHIKLTLRIPLNKSPYKSKENLFKSKFLCRICPQRKYFVSDMMLGDHYISNHTFPISLLDAPRDYINLIKCLVSEIKNQKKFKCPFDKCGKSFNHLNILSKHHSMMHNISLTERQKRKLIMKYDYFIPCEECSKKFYSYKDRSKHMAKAH